MTDIANLGYAVNTSSLKDAEQQLDKFRRSNDAAANSVDKMAASMAAAARLAANAPWDSMVSGLSRIYIEANKTKSAVDQMAASMAAAGRVAANRPWDSMVSGLSRVTREAVKTESAVDSMAAAMAASGKIAANQPWDSMVSGLSRISIEANKARASVDAMTAAMAASAKMPVNRPTETTAFGMSNHPQTVYSDSVSRGMSSARPVSYLDSVASGMTQSGLSSAPSTLNAVGQSALQASKNIGLANHELINLNRQMFDVGVSLYSGQNPLTVMIQQGAQIGEIFGQRGLIDIIKSLGTGILSLVSPTTLFLGGLAAAGWAAYEIWKAVGDDLPKLEPHLEKQTELIKELSEAYKGLGVDISEAIKASQGELALRSRTGLDENDFLMRREGRSFLSAVGGNMLRREGSDEARRPGPGGVFGNGELMYAVDAEFSKFEEPIRKLREQLISGVPDIEEFKKGIISIADAAALAEDLKTSEEIDKTAQSLLDMIPALAQLAAQARATRAAAEAASPEATLKRHADAVREYGASRNRAAEDEARARIEYGVPVPEGKPSNVDFEMSTPEYKAKKEAEELVQDLRFEAEQLRRTNEEQEVYNNLKRAGVSETSDLGKEIRTLTEANMAAEKAIRANKEALEEQQELIKNQQQYFADQGYEFFDGLIRGADDFRTALSKLLQDLSSQMLRAMLTGGGPMAAWGGMQGQDGAPGGFFGALMGLPVGPKAQQTIPPVAGTTVARSVLPGAAPIDTLDAVANGLTPTAAAAAPGGNSVDIAAGLLRNFEGYRSTPYWDVNAYRTGYGSDTTTDPATGAVSRVTPGMAINREMAEADLYRRIPEYQQTIQGQVGADAWTALNPQTQGALTSVAYNYGSLPRSVVGPVQSGNYGQIADAVGGLSANPARRAEEAALIRQSENLDQFGASVQSATESTSALDTGLSSVTSALGAPAGGVAAAGAVPGAAPGGGGLFDWLGGLFGGGAAPAGGVISQSSAIVAPAAAPAGGNILSGITGFIASLFGGGMADGGTIQNGMFALVGEEGPELAAAGAGGTRITPLRGRGGTQKRTSSGRSIVYAPQTYIDAKGSSLTEPRLSQILDERDRANARSLPDFIRQQQSDEE